MPRRKVECSGKYPDKRTAIALSRMSRKYLGGQLLAECEAAPVHLRNSAQRGQGEDMECPGGLSDAGVLQCFV